MKKYLFSVFVILAFSFPSNAQEKKERREKVKILKIAYLTEQLNLTSTEAEKFWSVYNEHNNDTHNYYRERGESIKKELKDSKSIDSIQEERAIILFDLMQDLERKKFKKTQKYYVALKTILPIKKILKLQIAEREFGRKLMREYRRKRSKNK